MPESPNKPVEPTGTSRFCQWTRWSPANKADRAARTASLRAVDSLGCPAAHPQRYMKDPRSFFARVLCALLLVCLAPLSVSAQPREATIAAPTGTYACDFRIWYGPHFVVTNSVPLFTLHLDTNGTYLAEYTEQRVPTQDGDLVRLLPKTTTARGVWCWDAQKREFRLEGGCFQYYIKCLPLDTQHTNRLVWGSSWLVREENK